MVGLPVARSHLLPSTVGPQQTFCELSSFGPLSVLLARVVCESVLGRSIAVQKTAAELPLVLHRPLAKHPASNERKSREVVVRGCAVCADGQSEGKVARAAKTLSEINVCLAAGSLVAVAAQPIWLTAKLPARYFRCWLGR